jgi:hypothetical protein
MPWYLKMVTETFLLSALTIVAGLISGACALCYKSKCSDVSCCCFKIHRDTKIEEEEDMASTKKQGD